MKEWYEKVLDLDADLRICENGNCHNIFFQEDGKQDGDVWDCPMHSKEGETQ